MRRRCCPSYFASCSAFPWGISGGSVAHRAGRGSRVLAVAPPEVPAVACRGCSLRRAEASSSPSDPSGSTAARQHGTREAHPQTHRNCSFQHRNFPKTPGENSNKSAPRRSSSASSQAPDPSVTFGNTAGFLLPSQTHHSTKNKPSEKSFNADISPVAGQEEGGKEHQDRSIISVSGFSPL